MKTSCHQHRVLGEHRESWFVLLKNYSSKINVITIAATCTCTLFFEPDDIIRNNNSGEMMIIQKVLSLVDNVVKLKLDSKFRGYGKTKQSSGRIGDIINLVGNRN